MRTVILVLASLVAALTLLITDRRSLTYEHRGSQHLLLAESQPADSADHSPAGLVSQPA